MLFVVFATFAAACGSEDEPAVDGGAAVDEAPGPSEASPPEEEATPPADANETPAPETTAPPELTDSFRGVTAEAIKVGVVAVDLESVRDLVNLDHGSYEAAYRALVEDVNARGGVNGRRIDMVFDSFLPIGTADMDTICARMTEDEEVFVVLGALLDDGPLCYTQLGDTAFIGSTQNDRRVAASTAPWFTPVRNADDALETTIRGFGREGVFDGKTVAVVALIADKASTESVALPTLADLGVEPVDVSYIEASPIDTVAAENEAALIAERQNTLGADVVLTVAGATAQFAGGLEDLSFRPQVASTSLSNMRVYIRDRGGRDLTVLDGAVAGNTGEQLEWWADPAIQDCITIVEAAGEPTILDPNTRTPDEPENIVSVAAACRDVGLFVAIATAAGVDLTNDSFRAAGEALGDFHVPGFGPGNFSAESPDSTVPIFYYEWDASIDDMASDGTTL